MEAREAADPGAAEREVLAEIGDPVRLAASYADRPSGLIGPDLLPAYTRIVVMLLTTLLPIVVVATIVLDVLDN